MKKKFFAHFGVKADEMPISGAYDALRLLKISENELFDLWVPSSDMLIVNGQTIKKWGIFLLLTVIYPPFYIEIIIKQI